MKKKSICQLEEEKLPLMGINRIEWWTSDYHFRRMAWTSFETYQRFYMTLNILRGQNRYSVIRNAKKPSTEHGLGFFMFKGGIGIITYCSPSLPINTPIAFMATTSFG